MKKRFRLACLFLSILCLICGCGREASREAAETVEAILTLCGDYPAGTLYQRSAEEGEVGYLSDSDFDLLYGENSAAYYLPLVEDYALYASSFATPFEVAVFRCYSSSDATRLGELLLQRADTLSVLLRELGLYEVYGNGILVTVVRRSAALVMAKEPPPKGKTEALLRATH